MYPLTPNPHLARKDTAFEIPDTGIAEYYERLSQRTDYWRRYAMQKRQQDKADFADLVSWEVSDDLMVKALQDKMSERATEYLANAEKMYGPDYSLSPQQRINLITAKNALDKYQSQLLRSQDIYFEAKKAIEKNPDAFDVQYFKDQEAKLMSGDPMNTFLKVNSVDPIIHLSNYAKEELSYPEETETRVGDKTYTRTKRVPDPNLTDEDLETHFENEYQSNTAFRLGVEEDFINLPEDEQAKWKGDPLTWGKNNPQYKNAMRQIRMEKTGEDYKSSRGGGGPGTEDEEGVIYPSIDQKYYFAGENRKGEGPISYAAEITTFWTEDGKKNEKKQAFKDADIVSLEWRNPPGETDNEQWLAALSVPAKEGIEEFKSVPYTPDPNLSDEANAREKKEWDAVMQLFAQTEKKDPKLDPIKRGIIYVPYDELETVINKERGGKYTLKDFDKITKSKKQGYDYSNIKVPQ